MMNELCKNLLSQSPDNPNFWKMLENKEGAQDQETIMLPFPDII